MKLSESQVRNIVRGELKRLMPEMSSSLPTEEKVAALISDVLTPGQEIRIEDLYELVEEHMDAPGIDKLLVFRAISQLVDTGALMPINRGFLRI